MIRRSWTRTASIEETLALWAASLREIKTRIRPLFRQERVATNAGLFLEGLLGDEQRKTGWMRAEAAGDPGPWRRPLYDRGSRVARHPAGDRGSTLRRRWKMVRTGSGYPFEARVGPARAIGCDGAAWRPGPRPAAVVIATSNSAVSGCSSPIFGGAASSPRSAISRM